VTCSKFSLDGTRGKIAKTLTFGEYRISDNLNFKRVKDQLLFDILESLRLYFLSLYLRQNLQGHISKIILIFFIIICVAVTIWQRRQQNVEQSLI